MVATKRAARASRRARLLTTPGDKPRDKVPLKILGHSFDIRHGDICRYWTEKQTEGERKTASSLLLRVDRALRET